MSSNNGSQQFDWQRLSAADSRLLHMLLPVAILAVTFLAYAATLALGFVFDDHVLIVTNDSIRSWHYFPTYFTSHIWSFRYPHLLANYYRPLFLTWLRVNDMLFGLRAWGWHLTSVLAHLGVTYWVYRLSFRLTRDPWASALAGLLFGLHPVHVEAVADITSIQEPLSTLFILGALLTFCRSRESSGGLRWLAASLVLTAAALLSKESGMVVPVLIAGYAWIYASAGRGEAAPVKFPLFSSLRSALVASIPYWLVVLAYVPLRVRALKGFAHVVTPLPISQEILTVPSVLLFYLRLMVQPHGLSCYYDTPYVSSPSWKGFIFPAVVLGAVALVLAYWYWRAKRSAPSDARAIAFATLLMLVTVAPVLNFRYLPEGEIAHDRYVYLPSVGFVILLALLLVRILANAVHHNASHESAPLPQRLLGLLVLCLMASTGYLTLRQTLFWSDDLTLNFRAHQIAPGNVYATTSLAAALMEKGMDGPAMALYQQALATQPNFWRANVNLGYLYYSHGSYPDAARYFARSCSVDPTDGDQFLYLGMSLLRSGRTPEAENAVRTALVVRPQGRNYHLGLAMVLAQEGRLAEAKQEIGAELAEDPQNAQARELLGVVEKRTEALAGKAGADRAPSSGPTHLK